MKSILFLAGLAAVAGALNVAAARAEPDEDTVAASADDGCALHKWGINRAIGLLSESSGPVLAGPDAVWTRGPGSSFFLKLSPLSQAGIITALEGAPLDPQSLAGAVRLADVARGEYQISLSEPASIDVVQDGKIVPLKKESGAADCEVASSVRVKLKRGDVVLQVTGTNAQKVGVVIERHSDAPKMRGPRN
ncbi:MAG: hypothetical protein WD076_06470 [Parvularculaceae bacterium]